MADWAIYWRDYGEESGADGRAVTGWLSGRPFVKRLQRGDRVWLFIAGDACGDAEFAYRGYLAQLLVVEGWGDNANEETVKSEVPKYRIEGIPSRCVLVTPPALIDHLLRQENANPTQAIGIARQTPFELGASQVDQLLELLKDKHTAVYDAATVS